MPKRNREIKIRFTDDEIDILNAKVASCKTSREMYCRSVLNNVVPHEAPPVDYYELISELRNIGSSINQLLKAVYKDESIDVAQLRKTLDDYRKTEQMIWRSFRPEGF